MAVVLACGLVLAGCGGDDDKSDNADSGAAKKIAFVIANTQQNMCREMADGFRTGAGEVKGVEPAIIGPDATDGPAQARLFEEATKTHPDGVSLFTLTPKDLVDPMTKANQGGTPLAMVDNLLSADTKVELYIGNDNRALGRMLAEQAISKLPANASGTVVLGITGPGNPVLEVRVSGMKDAFKEKLPNVQVLGPFETKLDEAANHAAWEQLVKANPNALAFLGPGNADAFNLADIRKTTGGKWVAGGFDLDPRSLQAVKEGNLLLVSPEHFAKGEIAGNLMATAAKTGKPLPKGWYYTEGLAVTPANIDEILARQKSLDARKAWFAPRVKAILASKSSVRPLSAAYGAK